MIAYIIALLIALGIIGNSTDYYDLPPEQQEEYYDQYNNNSEDDIVVDVIGYNGGG